MNGRTVCLAGGILVCASVAIVAAQTLVVNVNLTGATVRVYDVHRRPVLNLTPEDFEVLENGQSRPLDSFSVDRQSAAVGLLVDRSISVAKVKSAVFHTVHRIVESLDGDDQAFLMSFSTAAQLDFPLTNDHAGILSAWRRLKPASGTRFYDATITALDELSLSKQNHKALIIVTDGADHYSHHTFRELLKTARLYGYAINVIGYDGDDSRSWTTAGRDEIRTELGELSAATGGQVFFPSDEAEAKVVVEQILQSIHSAYHLSFYTSQPTSESWDVEIRIRNRPDLTVFPSLPD